MAGVALLSLGVYFLMVRKNPKANNALFPITIFAWADVASDVLFTISLHSMAGMGQLCQFGAKEGKGLTFTFH